MKVNRINIDNLSFRWGDKIHDIKTQIKGEDYFENENQYSNFQTLRVKTNEFLGIKTNSIKFSSPYNDRIINTIRINLPLINNEFEEVADKLINNYGNFTENRVSERKDIGSVTNYYKWTLKNVHLGISIFGGTRSEYNEKNKGMISLVLRDIELLHKLYSDEITTEYKKLTNQIDNRYTYFKMFNTEIKQRQSHQIEKEHYPEHEQNYISTALNGFMKRKILTTPDNFRNRLESNQVCIFKPKESEKYYIGNKYECCVIDNKSELKWLKTLPAKGPGNNWLSIENMSFIDTYKSKSIETLVKSLSQKLLSLHLGDKHNDQLDLCHQF